MDLKIDGGKYAVLVAADGTIIQREVQVAMAIVPPAVIEAGTKAHADGKIAEVAIITRGDKMFYELEMKVAKEGHVLEVAADGNVIADTVAKPEADEKGEKKD